ncbi:hypothetical protein F1714_12145, partial [Streptococcus pneumoniae]
PDLALPVTNPWLFFPDFELVVGDPELERLGIDRHDLDVYVVPVAAIARRTGSRPACHEPLAVFPRLRARRRRPRARAAGYRP